MVYKFCRYVYSTHGSPSVTLKVHALILLSLTMQFTTVSLDIVATMHRVDIQHALFIFMYALYVYTYVHVAFCCQKTWT